MNQRLLLTNIISFFVLASVLITPLLVFSQNCNSTNSPLPNPVRAHWKQNVQVAVTINNGQGQFNSQEIQCIKDAFLAWQGNSGTTGNASGVTFSFNESPTEVVSLTPSTPTSGASIQPGGTTPTPDSPVFQVSKKVPGYDHDYAETGMGTTDPNRPLLLSGAATSLDPGVSNCQAIKEIISHEIGHTYALNHCNGSSCSASNSAMVQGPACTGPQNQYGVPTCTPAELNRTGVNTVGPSECDNFKAKSYSGGDYNPATVSGGGTGEPGDPTPTPDPGDDPGGNGCSLETIPGQCYQVCATYCYGDPDPYTGNYNPEQCQESCETQCDPDQTILVCW